MNNKDYWKNKYLKYKKKYLHEKNKNIEKKAGGDTRTNIVMGIGVCVGIMCLINRRQRINSENNYITQTINLIQTKPKNFLKEAMLKGESIETGIKLYTNEDYQLFNDKEFDLIFEAIFDSFDRLQPGSNDYYVLKKIIPNNSKVIFLGDYHSSIHALIDTLIDLKNKGYFDNYWVLRKDCYLVVTGDMVDRGPYGIEIVYLLFLLFLNNNKEEYKFFIINGNHEEESIYSNYGLSLEIENQFKSDSSKKSFEKLLTKLPVALFLKSDKLDSKWYQFCHGGIDFQQYGDDDKITNFLKSEDRFGLNLEINLGHNDDLGFEIKNGFLWSDFTNNDFDKIIDATRPIFPPKIVERILDKNNIQSVISGHQDFDVFGFVYRPSLRLSDNFCEDDPTLDYNQSYPKTSQASLCTLNKIKNSKSGDGSSQHVINMNMAMVIITSSSTISKSVPKACYGVLNLSSNMSSINLLDTCNTRYLDDGTKEPTTCNN